MSLTDTIKALKRELSEAFPEGGVTITVRGDRESEMKKMEFKIERPETALDDIKKMLNYIAHYEGADTAIKLVEELASGSNQAVDIPKSKYQEVVDAYNKVKGEQDGRS